MGQQVNFQEELQKLTLSSLSELGKWIEGAKDFALREMPLFVQEYVRWYAANAAINIVMSFIAILLLVLLLTMGAKYCFNRSDAFVERYGNYSDNESSTACFVFGVVCRIVAIIGITICFFVIGSNAKDVAKAYWAPRVVVVEGIKDIITLKSACNK